MNSNIIRPSLHRCAYGFLLAFCLMLCGIGRAVAQDYSVASFRVLPNDVSAFVSTVRDLNDEACALVKVEAPSDFAFSTPLGIVKRKDEVGEIWLYLPRGTKMLTLKHPVWGVLRDYKLGMPLESRVTYELRLNLPKPLVAAVHDTIVEVKTAHDTITLAVSRPRQPLSAHVLATVGAGDGSVSYGLMLAVMRRHGAFVHALSDFGSIGTAKGHCAKDGALTDGSGKPYYSGRTRRCHYAFTAGAIHNIAGGWCLFEGIGYGRSDVAWQLAPSEGGGYVLNDALSRKGMAAEIGASFAFGRLTVSASVVTIAGKWWQGGVGIGVRLCGKRSSKKMKY